MKIKLFFFWFLFVVLFCVLGCWQLKRYHYKKNLLASYQNAFNQSPVQLEKIKNPNKFQHIFVSGEWQNVDTVLLQNRFYHDQLGFEVLTVFKPFDSKKYLLVDRGWVPQIHDDVLAVLNKQKITGYIHFLDEYQFILGKNILQPKARPIIAQKINLVELGQIFGKDFFPFILRLDQTSPNGFAREWTITTVLPERHLGYAVQWFLMACVLLIASIYFCFRRD